MGGKRVSTIHFETAAACTDGEEANASPLYVGSVAGANDVLREGTGSAVGSSGGGGGALFGVETTDGQVFEADAVVLAVGITAAKVRTPHNSTPHANASDQMAHHSKTHTPPQTKMHDITDSTPQPISTTPLNN